jgi:hypothetical protein
MTTQQQASAFGIVRDPTRQARGIAHRRAAEARIRTMPAVNDDLMLPGAIATTGEFNRFDVEPAARPDRGKAQMTP